jgi:hypothetical protein
MLEVMARVAKPHGVSIIWDIEAGLADFPAKVVRAKLQSMVRRKLIDGCTCGCRGDFEPTGAT